MAIVDATAAIGPGDRTVLERSVRAAGGTASGAGARAATPPARALVVVVNKIDRANGPASCIERLTEAKAAVDALGRPVGSTSSTSRSRRAPARAWRS